jgi:phosphoserine phosphatase RsbU/P
LHPQPSVLLVDDDVLARHCLREVLTDSGYRVLEAADGAEATRVLMHTRPDAVLLDLVMPHLSGVELLGELKARDAQLPVIVVSGMDVDSLVEQVMRTGASAFIAKPFHPLEVVNELSRLLVA